MCPVWTIFYKNKFYFSTDDYSLKVRIIEETSSKIGLTIIEPDSFPQGRPGVIPYFSTSGNPRIRTKADFVDYNDVIHALYDKFNDWFPNQEAKDQWVNFVMNESENRVLVEFKPERTFIYEKIEQAVAKQKTSK